MDVNPEGSDPGLAPAYSVDTKRKKKSYGKSSNSVTSNHINCSPPSNMRNQSAKSSESSLSSQYGD